MGAKVQGKATIGHLRKIGSKRLFGKLTLKLLAQAGACGDTTVLYERLGPAARLPNVYHSKTSEWLYCLSGSMSAIVDGRRHRLSAGSMLFLPPGVRHRFVTAKRACEALSIFSPALDLGRGGDVHVEP